MQISLRQGDITRQSVDIIVNAANSSLLGGGGVDGAIHRAGGKEILEACREIRSRQGNCKTGEAVITTAGRLPARWVIHTVGPVWQGGASEESRLLANCYRNSLKLAEEKEARTIAFPNISTGIYGYPKERAAEVALDAVRAFKSSSLEEVIFVCYDEDNFAIYHEMLASD
ncbi:O-acetyl-ADP-ribose deacetylase [Lewinella sp. IMCC34191]|uniref:O-acetyl-ADP-ribose deacetylase n=1 Tax=Lewinella sp. IMCC34191 TaxID=2259172 RepID=UPI000E223A85|nr:O-acetyl-ADP-ribose deacetylase [Lewinella sp. IMCC34191]